MLSRGCLVFGGCLAFSGLPCFLGAALSSVFVVCGGVDLVFCLPRGFFLEGRGVFRTFLPYLPRAQLPYCVLRHPVPSAASTLHRLGCLRLFLPLPSGSTSHIPRSTASPPHRLGCFSHFPPLPWPATKPGVPDPAQTATIRTRAECPRNGAKASPARQDPHLVREKGICRTKPRQTT